MIREIIKEAMKLHKIGPVALAKAIGVSKVGMTSFLCGKYNFTSNKIEKAFEVLGIEFVIKQSKMPERAPSRPDIRWNDMFNRVKSYHANTGTWPSTICPDKEVKKLGWWCVCQRRYLREGKLSNTRKEMLDSIEFDWGIVHRDRWTEMFEALKRYRSNTGKWPHAKSDNKDEGILGRWLCQQRAMAKGKKGYKILPDRLEKLKSIDFWNYTYRGKAKKDNKGNKGKDKNIGSAQTSSPSWDVAYEAVKEIKQSTGEWPVKGSKDIQGTDLCIWCNRQREYMKRGSLSSEKQAQLNDIGFEWIVRTHDWDNMYETVKKYREYTGQWPGASSKDDKIARLGRWCNLQKHRLRKGLLNLEKQIKLKEIGLEAIDFRKPDYRGRKGTTQISSGMKTENLKSEKQVKGGKYAALWYKTYADVEKYKKATGKWPTSTSKNADAAKLGVWCNRQRQCLKKGLLSPERQAKLNEIGFWEPSHSTSWDMKCSAVKKYRDSTGKWPSASSKDAEISELGRWCAMQRQFMKKGRLNSERQAKLNEISFDWALRKGK